MTARNLAVTALLLGSLLVAPVRADDDPPAVERPVPAAKAPKKPAAAEKKPLEQREFRAPAPRTLAEALSRMSRIHVDVDFRDMPFAKAVEFVGAVSGFNVIVGPELAAQGVDAQPPVTLKLRAVSVKQLAELIVRFSDTKLRLNEGILEFTTKEAARGKPVLRIYSIGDVSMPLRNFPGPDIQLRPSGAEFEPEEETLVESPFGDADGVAELIQRMVDEETWSDEGVSISAHGHKLIVRQYPEVHRKIARLLAALRGAR